MIINKIVRSVSPDEIRNIVRDVENTVLPPEIELWSKEYQTRIGTRSPFTWYWLYNVVRLSRFIPTDAMYEASLDAVRFLVSMFVIVLDDSADVLQDEKIFSSLAQIPFYGAGNSTDKHIQFAASLWHAVRKDIQKLPRYNEFKDLFYFDLTQVINTTKYGLLINQYPYLINKEEYWLYFPTTMQAMLYTTILLMGSSIEKEQVGKIRELSFFAQHMVRIGNWMSTWERELQESDVTSIVFPYALEEGFFSLEDILYHKTDILKKADQASLHDLMIKKLSGEWESYYGKIEQLGKMYEDLLPYVQILLPQLERMLVIELASKSLK